MSSLGRKLARQNKRQSPEGKEQIKEEQAKKQAAQPQQNQPLLNQNSVGFQPRLRQRRSGNA
jgi:hypothetical protein